MSVGTGVSPRIPLCKRSCPPPFFGSCFFHFLLPQCPPPPIPTAGPPYPKGEPAHSGGDLAGGAQGGGVSLTWWHLWDFQSLSPAVTVLLLEDFTQTHQKRSHGAIFPFKRSRASLFYGEQQGWSSAEAHMLG